MATNANWTVIFEDRCVIKNTGAEAGTGYIIDDNAFWTTTDFKISGLFKQVLLILRMK
jgi:hypothetical protein